MPTSLLIGDKSTCVINGASGVQALFSSVSRSTDVFGMGHRGAPQNPFTLNLPRKMIYVYFEVKPTVLGCPNSRRKI